MICNFNEVRKGYEHTKYENHTFVVRKFVLDSSYFAGIINFQTHF